MKEKRVRKEIYTAEEIFRSNDCEAFAKYNLKKFAHGRIVRITPIRAPFLGDIHLPDDRGTINGWAYHVTFVKDGIVYDRLTGPLGMPVSEYKKMFAFSEALDFGF